MEQRNEKTKRDAEMTKLKEREMKEEPKTPTAHESIPWIAQSGLSAQVFIRLTNLKFKGVDDDDSSVTAYDFFLDSVPGNSASDSSVMSGVMSTKNSRFAMENIRTSDYPMFDFFTTPVDEFSPRVRVGHAHESLSIASKWKRIPEIKEWCAWILRIVRLVE
jgi:hypothetical protein